MNAEQQVAEAPQHTDPQHSVAQPRTESHADDGGSFEPGEEGQRNSAGMGQSKSSRRRRRKRKGSEGGQNAGAESGADAAQGAESDGAPTPMVLPGESIQARQSAPQPQGHVQQQPRGFAGPGNLQGQNGSQNGNAPGTKRWKKKFRDRQGRAMNENPGNNFAAGAGGYSQGQNGNSFNANGSSSQQVQRGQDTHQPGNNAFKRKGGGGFGNGGKQRNGGGGGSRGGFVGPMDHSYRAPNGNVFDPSASTVEQGGRRSSHQGDSQPIDYSQGRAIPIKEGAPTRIYFFIDDLFFTAKIQETARKLGVKIAFLKNEKEQIATLLASTEEERPGLIVFDLNNASAKPMTLIPKLKSKLKKSTSIVGFLSTLQGELRAKAVEAGCDTVMPRAAFSQNLPPRRRRYGIEDVEDNTNYNQ